jgi:DnaJ-domain-containing protein 1
MGQIFNRIKYFIKTEFNSNKDNSNIDINDFDDELKKIIDDLNSNNNQKHTYNKNGNSSREKTNDFNRQPLSREEQAERNAYNILGIDKNNSIEGIKSAYKTKIKEYHPDKAEMLDNKSKSDFLKKAQDINNAYNLLKKVKNF